MLVVAGGSVAAREFGNAFYFSGEGAGCTYASCWPLHQQTAALVAPGVLAGLTMAAMALLVRRAPWTVRALTPVLVWAVALIVQQAIWAAHLLPLFEGPPP